MVQHKQINNVLNHINRLTNKNHMIISKDSEKPLKKIQHTFIIKVLENVELERTNLNTIKVIYKKCAANIFLN